MLDAIAQSMARAAGRLHRAPEDRQAARAARADGPRRASRSTGAWASCSRTARCSTRASTCGCPARTARAARSRHRHAIITDIKTGREHLVLGGLHADQGRCRIYDSPLSEAGVLGFEFGYSLDYPDALVMWEAQFGDFANGAQVIIDQFIIVVRGQVEAPVGPRAAAAARLRRAGARALERAARALPAELRRAQHPGRAADDAGADVPPAARAGRCGALRKPLIVMTPKSLLRLPAAASSLDELATRHVSPRDPRRPRRSRAASRACCSAPARSTTSSPTSARRRGATNIAIMRIEQLYPVVAAADRGVGRGLRQADRGVTGSRTSPRTWAPRGSSRRGSRRYAPCSTC